METSGTTYDWLSWQCSPLFTKLEEAGLPHGFWIAADNAYLCSSYMITPYPGRGIGQEKGTFNFFQLSGWIHVEQAFGILVRQWGILWQRLDVAMWHWPLTIMCCMKLHNVCCRDRIDFDYPLGRMAAFWQQGPTLGDNASINDSIQYVDSECVTYSWDDGIRRHRYREPEEYCDILAKELSDHGYIHPGYSSSGAA